MLIGPAVLGIVLVSQSPAGPATPGAQPSPPRVQAPDPVTPPAAAAERWRVVCGMTLVTPDDHTRFPIRELTPPPNAPRFAMRTIPGECERVVPFKPGDVVAVPMRAPKKETGK